jgi:hypothetical protein
MLAFQLRFPLQLSMGLWTSSSHRLQITSNMPLVRKESERGRNSRHVNRASTTRLGAEKYDEIHEI